MRLESVRSTDHAAADAANGTVDLGLRPDDFRFFDAETVVAIGRTAVFDADPTSE